MTEHKERKRREFAARLRKAVDYRGWKEHGKHKRLADEFVRRGIDMTPMSVGRWFHAVTLPNSGNIQVLAEILNVQADWLMTGRGPMVYTEVTDTQGQPRRVVVHELPLLEAQEVRPFLDGDIEPDPAVLVAGILSKKAFTIRLAGQSLAPKIAAGTLLVVDPEQQISTRVPLMAIHNGVPHFGYPVDQGDSVILEPVNTQYPIQVVTRPEVIGPVVALAQQFLTDTA